MRKWQRPFCVLLGGAQGKAPDKPRALYLNIDDYRNDAGGFGNDCIFKVVDFLLPGDTDICNRLSVLRGGLYMFDIEYVLVSY